MVTCTYLNEIVQLKGIPALLSVNLEFIFILMDQYQVERGPENTTIFPGSFTPFHIISSIHLRFYKINNGSLTQIDSHLSHCRLPILNNKVVHKPNLHTLVTLGYGNVSAVPSLTVNHLKPPNLGGNPATVFALDDDLDKLALTFDQPAVLKEVVINLVVGNPHSLADDGTKQ